MNYTINPYKRKNGVPMIYINAFNNQNGGKVSLGISENVYSSKLTKGQKNILAKLGEIVNEYEKVEINDIFSVENHSETKVNLAFDIVFLATDKGQVGNLTTGEDGGYIFYKNNLYFLGRKK